MEIFGATCLSHSIELSSHVSDISLCHDSHGKGILVLVLINGLTEPFLCFYDWFSLATESESKSESES